MNNEAKLLSKVIESRNLGLILERGVDAEWFADANDKKIFTFLQKHFTDYQECPSLDLVIENFPTYSLLKVEDNIEYFLDLSLIHI